MHPDWTAIVVLSVTAVMVVAIVKIVSENRMRNKLIDKGLVDEKVKFLFSDRLLAGGPSALKWGMVLVAIGAAVIAGLYFREERRAEITVALIFAGSGLALIIYYFVARHMKNGKPPQA